MDDELCDCEFCMITIAVCKGAEAGRDPAELLNHALACLQDAYPGIELTVAPATVH